MNQRINQPLTPQPSRPARRQHHVLVRATALLASAAAAGVLTVVIANGIVGGDGVGGTGNNAKVAGAIAPAANGVINAN